MIYGNPQVIIDNDTTDRIGVRTLVLSKMWQPAGSNLSQAEIEAAKPDVPGTEGGVLLIGVQTRRAGGVYKTTWTFEGIEGDGKGVTFKTRGFSLDYGFEPSFSQVPIELFPTFQDLLKNYNGAFSADDSKVIWPATLPNTSASQATGLPGNSSTQKGTPNPMFGHEDFFRIEGTYRYRYASLSAPSQANAGFIASNLPGGPPSIGDRNWLFAGAPFKRRGLIFDITENYWLSGAGGWPEPVYKNGSPSGSGGAGGGFGGLNFASYAQGGNPLS